MKSLEIRKKFFDYFMRHGHEKVASSSLIPAQDPTLLFANAGMNQFKDLFLGKESRSYKRAVSIQKCMRAGGKHNDLDNVGFTKRHLTFFEMMGNFSFGDYFKKEAINFAWEFVTKDLSIPAHELHVSVFQQDEESYELWHSMVGIPTERIHRLGAKDNFWQMGDTGPCGPCTEIYIDRGQQLGCQSPTCAPGCDCDRFLEFWNIVFMQFDRQPDGTDKPLKQTGVDTGMGLERLCAIVQQKDSVYETDLFANILTKIEELSGKIYSKQDKHLKAAFHVIADHIRSTSMLIADGCAPSNEGRGYVLRKIIRRAALFTQKLTDKNIFPALSAVVVHDLGDSYPELISSKTIIFEILTSEIDKFSTNLVRGKLMLGNYFAQHQESKLVSGQEAFKLYDTFGFPTELIEIMAHENGFKVDNAGFQQEMLRQKEQSGKKGGDTTIHVDLDPAISSEFTGYHELTTASTIQALVHDQHVVTSVAPGQTCLVIAEKSPFFIVGGGQVPDQGWLTIDNHRTPITSVGYINNAIAAQIKAPVTLNVGMAVTSEVDKQWRTNAMKNHTATHMLQAALIEILGKQVKQSGSFVHPDYLRFDFTCHDPLASETIKRVEDLVNEKIRDDIQLNIEYMSMKDAVKRGALAFFGDKYNPEQVRLVDIPGFSVELCGGTHVPSTGIIGTFKITEVSSLAAGHKRIVAVTGPKAIELFQHCFDTVKTLSQEFKVKREDVLDAIDKNQEQIRQLQADLKKFKKQHLQSQIAMWLAATELVQGVPFLFLMLDDLSNQELKEITTQLQAKRPGLYFVATTIADKQIFFCSVAADFAQKIDMRNFANWLKDTHNLRGGTTPCTVQGGGTFTSDLKDQIKGWLTKMKAIS